MNAFISRLFLCSSKTQLALHPSKSSCTSSSVCYISIDQKTMPVQMSISLFFEFPSRCGWNTSAELGCSFSLGVCNHPFTSSQAAWWAIQLPNGKRLFTSDVSVQPWYRTFQCCRALQSMAPWEMTSTLSNRRCLLECEPGLLKCFLGPAHCRFAPGWLADTSRPASLHTYIEPCTCGFRPQCLKLQKQWGLQL